MTGTFATVTRTAKDALKKLSNASSGEDPKSSLDMTLIRKGKRLKPAEKFQFEDKTTLREQEYS